MNIKVGDEFYWTKDYIGYYDPALRLVRITLVEEVEDKIWYCSGDRMDPVSRSFNTWKKWLENKNMVPATELIKALL